MNGTTAYDWIVGFSDRFADEQEQLSDLDRQLGDGDFGTNIASALTRVEQALPSRSDATPAAVFTAVSTGFLATGGTSGPLFGMFFREMGNAFDSDELTVKGLAQGVANGLAAVERLGKAAVGDATMVDAISPAADALGALARSDCTAERALHEAATSAREGAQSTADIVAARGRASYVGELGRGVLDPGAAMVAMFFETGAAMAEGEVAAPSR